MQCKPPLSLVPHTSPPNDFLLLNVKVEFMTLYLLPVWPLPMHQLIRTWIFRFPWPSSSHKQIYPVMIPRAAALMAAAKAMPTSCEIEERHKASAIIQKWRTRQSEWRTHQSEERQSKMQLRLIWWDMQRGAHFCKRNGKAKYNRLIWWGMQRGVHFCQTNGEAKYGRLIWWGINTLVQSQCN